MKCLSIIFVIAIFHSSCAQDSEWQNSRFYPQFPMEKPWLPAKRAVKYDISYSYDGETGPDAWPMMFKECGGKKQSPINIKLAEAQNLTVKKPLQWSSTYFVIPQSMTLMDNGHTLELEMKYPDEEKPKLSRGPLSDFYALKSLHFHWASCPSKGCEHFIDGFCHPVEMHMIHERECSKNSGHKYLVVAFFFQLGEEGSPALDYIAQVANKAAKNPHKKIKLRHNFSLCDLFQPFTCEYLMYKGSFTTPPCTEGVTWILNPYPLAISKKQIEKFRGANTLDPALKDNFRPCQPLNGRTVYFVT